MEDSALFFGAYGLIFCLGLALVLRPVVILTSLIFRPSFLVLSAVLVFGVRAALLASPADSAPVVAGGVAAFVIGSAVGFPLRFLARGGL